MPASSIGETHVRRASAPTSLASRSGTEGELKSFTIVSFAAPGVPVPFVAGLVDIDGTTVRGNVINTAPDPEHVSLGMKVRLATHSVGTDSNGTEAIGFGFEPC